MIISPEKLQDMQIRDLMLECMQIALRNGLIEDAKAIGECAAIFRERIKNNNYPQVALTKLN